MPAKAKADSLMPSWLPRVNKLITNPVQGLWAPYVPPYAVIVHRGRTSGRQYRTPVTAFRSGSRLAIPLPYGTGTDWVRNLLAADGGKVHRAGRLHTLARPHLADPAEIPQLPRMARLAAKRMHILVADLA
jgi:deazaflavin-dependent oxidoreductase (nitroreductase family)